MRRLFLGDVVVALSVITEGGPGVLPDYAATPTTETDEYVHAFVGDVGDVVYIDPLTSATTVKFRRTGTATRIIPDHEVLSYSYAKILRRDLLAAEECLVPLGVDRDAELCPSLVWAPPCVSCEESEFVCSS